jgi:hypothetical protein
MNESNKKYLLLAALVFLMALTRNGHSLTSLSLPDATFAIFFISGYSFKNIRWFSFLFLLSTLIDASTSLVNPSMNLWHNISYFGMIFTYGAMWLGGFLLTKVKSSIYFLISSLLSTVIAFIISTQTYNLLSGAFPDINIKESIQSGWEYLPQSLIYTMSYLMAYWGIQLLFTRYFVSQKATAL